MVGVGFEFVLPMSQQQQQQQIPPYQKGDKPMTIKKICIMDQGLGKKTNLFYLEPFPF